MTDPARESAVVLLALGALAIASMVMRTELARFRLPAMAGYIFLGVGLSYLNSLTSFISPAFEQNVDFLAELGVAILLFRVGLESDLGMLARQLRNASLIWLPDVVVSATAAFLAVYFWPGYGLIPALFAAAASSATSVGVSTAVWEEAGKLGTPQGALLLDVAELDDISAVIVLSILFSVVPLLENSEGGPVWAEALLQTGAAILKIVLFTAACYVFSRRIERPLTAWFGRLEPRVGPILFAAGSAFMIAAVANLIGFSIAIGALFAGLAFSRDPQEQEIDRSFAILFAVFGPFFFLAIGLAAEVTALGRSLGIGLVLFAAAALGKFVGAGVPAALITSARSGALIGLSMIPRAEIFLIVMLYGLTLGEWAVPESLYTAAITVSLATCILSPVVVRMLLQTGPDTEESA